MITPEEVQAMPHKVFCALPQGELSRYSDFEHDYEHLICPPNTIKRRLFGIYIANLQNALAREFLKTDYEWFWLVNDDQSYPPDTLVNLLARGKDVIVPVCLEKNPPHFPIIYGEKATANGINRHRITLKRGQHGLIRVGACGGGGLLIHRRVFEAIPDPWWEVTTGKNEAGIYEQSSEDYDFCAKVQAAGFDIWCDLDVSVVHIAHYGLRPIRDERTGEWYTVLIRNGEQVLLPAAAPPASRIIVPEPVFNLVKA